jgi:hypothetical protein
MRFNLSDHLTQPSSYFLNVHVICNLCLSAAAAVRFRPTSFVRFFRDPHFARRRFSTFSRGQQASVQRVAVYILYYCAYLVMQH